MSCVFREESTWRRLSPNRDDEQKKRAVIRILVSVFIVARTTEGADPGHVTDSGLSAPPPLLLL